MWASMRFPRPAAAPPRWRCDGRSIRPTRRMPVGKLDGLTRLLGTPGEVKSEGWERVKGWVTCPRCLRRNPLSDPLRRRERKRRELGPSRIYNFSLSKPRIPGREPGDRLSGPPSKVDDGRRGTPSAPST